MSTFPYWRCQCLTSHFVLVKTVACPGDGTVLQRDFGGEKGFFGTLRSATFFLTELKLLLTS